MLERIKKWKWKDVDWKKLDYSQMYTLIHVLTYYNYKKRGV